MERHKKLSNKRFEACVDKLANGLKDFTKKNNIRIDYVCPIMRSGAIPAVYIANKLNVVKFAPIQTKHVKGEKGYVKLFMPFEGLNITKKEPVFLIVDAICASGKSGKMCIDEFKSKYPNAKLLYVCISKEYGSQTFKDKVIYEDYAFYYNGRNQFTKTKCDELNIEHKVPLYPWEILEQEREHPDDLEENIFY